MTTAVSKKLSKKIFSCANASEFLFKISTDLIVRMFHFSEYQIRVNQQSGGFYGREIVPDRSINSGISSAWYRFQIMLFYPLIGFEVVVCLYFLLKHHKNIINGNVSALEAQTDIT